MSLAKLRHDGTTRAVKSAAVAAALVIGLAACGSPQAAPSPQATSSSSSPRPTVPSVVGKSFGDAQSSLLALDVHFVFKGPDGVEFDSAPDSAMITGTEPASGSTVPQGTTLVIMVDTSEKDIQAKAAADAAKAAAAARATRYDYRCSTESDAITATGLQHFNSPQAVWAAPDFAQLKSCDLYVGGNWWRDRFPLEPDEQAAVNQLAADGGDASIPSGAFGDILMACALPPKVGWETSLGPDKVRVQAIAKAALRMCPTAPFAAELQRVADGVPPSTFTDGTYVVGQDIQAGTYQVQGSVHDCYWERTDSHGGTIANDLITFAPQGPIVTVYAGEGFVSERCGTWSKIG